MHKVFAGLRDAHLHADSAAALDVLTKLAAWTAAATAPMNDEQLQRMLRTEHGGMNEVLADVAALTGDTKYLALARRFSHEALLAPLADVARSARRPARQHADPESRRLPAASAS